MAKVEMLFEKKKRLKDFCFTNEVNKHGRRQSGRVAELLKKNEKLIPLTWKMIVSMGDRRISF